MPNEKAKTTQAQDPKPIVPAGYRKPADVPDEYPTLTAWVVALAQQGLTIGQIARTVNRPYRQVRSILINKGLWIPGQGRTQA